MTSSPADFALDQLSVDTLRLLAVDTIEKAKSGHPGAPLGCAPIAYLLFNKLMKHNPANSKWADRDRFVLSNGHASSLLYSTLFLSGYKLELDDLKNFRQWDSRTPGHPERGETDGVEVTTGPLGQGIAMAVGMAIAERHLAAVYNRPGFEIVDHYTYALLGDGDLMEGISHEAAALAGHLKLGKLVYFWDDNNISLDGPTSLSFSEDVRKRFEAYGWQVLTVEDGNNLDQITTAIAAAKAESAKPTLIDVHTIIGFGSPKAGSNKSHGEPLGAEAVAATKKTLGFDETQSFALPEKALANWRTAVTRGTDSEAAWTKLFAAYKAQFPELAAEFERTQKGELKAGWEKSVPVFAAGKTAATRSTGGEVMNAIAEAVPELIGGAADLTSSTKTIFKPGKDFQADPTGRNIFFGVREFAMAAASNGIAAHGGLIPFCSTFFVFSDYAKPAMRLAALMQLHSLFVYTHDTIAVGEDGPTHQPIEQLAGLRAIPGLTDFRPADANESAAAWRLAIERKKPAFMALSRQNLPIIDTNAIDVYAGVSHGAYTVVEAADPQLVLIAAGSELWPAVEAAKLLEGLRVRVVSVPSVEIFEEQSAEYKAALLPKGVAKLAIEAGATATWWKYVGSEGDVIGLDRFGASAPGPKVAEELGFSPAAIAAKAKSLVK